MPFLIPFLANVALAADGEPDLRIDDLQATYIEATDTLFVSVTVINDGNAESGEFQLSGYSTADWDQCIPDMRMHGWPSLGLDPGEDQSFSLIIPGAHAEETFYLYVDLRDQVAESNEKNNAGYAILTDSVGGVEEVLTDWYWHTNPDCLVDFVDNLAGWSYPTKLEQFYAKLKLL